MKSATPILFSALIVGLASAATAAQFTLTGTATPTSRYTDFFSNSYAEPGLNPDGFYDLTTNTINGNPAGFDVFPTELVFALGTLTYNDAGLTGSGSESAPVTGLGLDVNQNVVINWGNYSTTLSALAGTVSLLDGTFTGANLTAGVTLTMTNGPAAGLSYPGGTFAITGTTFDLDVDATPIAFPLHLKWDISGGGVSTVPEPASAALAAFGLAGLAAVRRRNRAA